MSTVLSLTEYLNQADPIRMPIVKLQPDEYQTYDAYIVKKGQPDQEERKKILIKHYSRTYIQRNNSPQLYALKDDGNCDSVSCFWI